MTGLANGGRSSTPNRRLAAPGSMPAWSLSRGKRAACRWLIERQAIARSSRTSSRQDFHSGTKLGEGMNPLHDPLLRCLLLTLWLLPCAIQDWRTRHVSNWLTVPLFIVAWPVAALNGNLALTVAVSVGTYAAWASRAGLGAADGKVAAGLAAFAPQALLVGCLLQGLAFLVIRLRHSVGTSISGVTWFWAGALIVTFVEFAQPRIAR